MEITSRGQYANISLNESDKIVGLILLKSKGYISPFDLKDEFPKSYHILHRTFKNFHLNGFIDLKEEVSEKGGKKNFYILNIAGLCLFISKLRLKIDEIYWDEDQTIFSKIIENHKSLHPLFSIISDEIVDDYQSDFSSKIRYIFFDFVDSFVECIGWWEGKLHFLVEGALYTSLIRLIEGIIADPPEDEVRLSVFFKKCRNDKLLGNTFINAETEVFWELASRFQTFNRVLKGSELYDFFKCEDIEKTLNIIDPLIQNKIRDIYPQDGSFFQKVLHTSVDIQNHL